MDKNIATHHNMESPIMSPYELMNYYGTNNDSYAKLQYWEHTIGNKKLYTIEYSFSNNKKLLEFLY